MAIGTTVRIGFNATAVSRGLSSMRRNIKRTAKQVAIIGGAFAAIGVAVVAAAKKITDIGLAINRMGEIANTSRRRLELMVENTELFGDAAGEVSARLDKLASDTARMIGVDQKSIRLTMSRALAFDSLAESAAQTGGVFDRTLAAAYDIAAARGRDAGQVAEMLARALEDPERHMRRLYTIGVIFTQQQRDQILAMREAGDAAGAQEIMLNRMAAASRNAARELADDSERISQGIQQIREAFAGGFVGAFDGIADEMDSLIEPILEPTEQIGQRIGDAIRAAFTGNTEDLEEVGRIAGEAIGKGVRLALEAIIFDMPARIGQASLNYLSRLPGGGPRVRIAKAIARRFNPYDASVEATSKNTERNFQEFMRQTQNAIAQLSEEDLNPNRVTIDGRTYRPIEGGLDSDFDLFKEGQAYRLLERIARNTEPAIP